MDDQPFRSDVSITTPDDESCTLVVVALPYTDDFLLKERLYMRADEFVRKWFERQIAPPQYVSGYPWPK